MELTTIYQEYGLLVQRFLISLTHDPQLAEDLTQETFYQAVKSAHRFDGKSKVSTWLCQIAKHLWLQELSRRKKLPQTELPEVLLDERILADQNLITKEERVALFKAIHQLDDATREVVLLRLNGEFSFREIGEIVGRTENWSRVTFYRARQKIQKGLKFNEPT